MAVEWMGLEEPGTGVVVEVERRLIEEYLRRKVEMRLPRALAQGCC